MKQVKKRINVLVACEESQVVTRAFREIGHVAYSCDLQMCPSMGRGGRSEWHILGDCTPYIEGKRSFVTVDGLAHEVPQWDLIIAHPPCTYICKCSAPRMFKTNGVIDELRYQKMLEGVRFFRKCLASHAKFVCVENPLPLRIAGLPRPSTYFQPWWFGEPYSKKTLLWLKNLPPLMPTIVNPNFKQFVNVTRGKYRSRTFPLVAKAMANQWSAFILDE